MLKVAEISTLQRNVGVAGKRTMYQCKVDVDMLNAVKSVLADVSSPSSEQKSSDEGLTLDVRLNSQLFSALPATRN